MGFDIEVLVARAGQFVGTTLLQESADMHCLSENWLKWLRRLHGCLV